MEKNHICKKCGGIAGWDSYFQSWICTRCGNEEPKPSTNADRVMEAENSEKVFAATWIPVNERLPNGEAERYLVASSLTNFGLWVSICYYADNLEEVDEYDFKGENHSGFYYYDYEYEYCEMSGVQYWMPLPEPPKEAK